MACAPGTYQPLTGQDKCYTVIKGSYTSVSGASSFTACPYNTYSLFGQSICTECPPGRVTAFKGASSEDECVNPEFNFIQGFIVLGLVTPFCFDYIIRGRFKRVSFLRKYRISGKLVGYTKAKRRNMYTRIKTSRCKF